MSLAVCVPDLLAKGEITEAQASRMLDLFHEFERENLKLYDAPTAAAMASESTLKSLESDALLAKRRKLLQMQAQSNALKSRAAYKGDPAKGKWAAALIDRDGRAPYSNVEARRKVIAQRSHALMEQILDNFRRDVTGRVRNRALLSEVVREAFGEKTDNLSANELARAWTSTAEWLRERFNAAGGDIGKMDRWGLPQSHDSDKVRAAGYDAWSKAILPRLDRERMIDPTTQAPYSDPAIDRLLRAAFDTIRSQGWSKREPGMGTGKAAIAKRHSEARVLIMKSADDWMAYHEEFGKGTPFDAMMGHIDRMSREIAAMEILGPNPEATIRWLGDTMRKEAYLADAGDPQVAERAATKVNELWAEYTGSNRRPGSRKIANASSAVRSWQTASKLGSAIISAVPGDLGTQWTTARFNALPFTKILGNYMKAINPANASHRKLAIRMALGAEGYAQANAGTMRAFNAEMTREWASRLAEGVLRVQGLNAWTEGGRWAQGLAMFGHMADEKSKPFDKLDRGFRDMLQRYGFSSDDWDAIRATPLRKEAGGQWLFPEDVANEKLGDRLLEMASTERDLGVPVADLETRAMLHSLGQTGTIRGTVIENSLLFKSFGIAMLLTHGRRVIQMSSWRDRTSYMMGAAIVMTLAGAISIQMRAIAKGQNPQPMDTWAFWGSAMAQGGGFGMIGDLAGLALDPRKESWAEWIAGPTLESAANIGIQIKEVIRSAAGDRKAKPGAQAVKMLQSEVPGSNLWYTRLAYQRLFLDRLSEAHDPNYRSSWRRMERAARERGTDYWWAPGDAMPEDAPSFEHVLGAD